MRPTSRSRTLLLVALSTIVAAAGTAYGANQARYMAYPDIHGDRIVFVYENDLWTVPAGGGTAARLTSWPGAESNPTFSPDGAWIAFTASYDGASAV